MSKFGRSGHFKGRQNRRQDKLKVPVLGDQAKDTLESIDENSEIIQSFKKFSEQLDTQHDKHERLVKISRDITIESKRIIFLLHTLDRESKQESVLKEAESRIAALIGQHFMLIARELDGLDPYQFHRAFSMGLQEFIEALTFYHYLKENKFYSWEEYQEKLIYQVPNVCVKTVTESLANYPSPSQEEATKTIVAHIPPTDYILGIADLTGELMRKCINSLGAGDVQGCFQTCGVVRQIYTGFQIIGPSRSKEISHKIYTLRQSLTKMEYVCYNIHVRGSEIPKHMLTDVVLSEDYSYNDNDEGFCD